MLKLLAIALLLAVGSDCRSVEQQLPLTTPDMDTISIYIKKVLENLKEAMPNGIPELSIPPLEPLVLDVVDIPRIQEGVANVKLDMNNFRLEGLSSFVVDKAKGDLENMGIELDLFFPVLKGRSGYNLDGRILIFPLYGKGTAHLQVDDLRLHLKAAVSLVNMRQVQLTNLKVDASFSQVQMYLEGIAGGGNLGDVVNQLLNALGKLAFDKLKHLFLPEIVRIIQGAVNNELRKVNIRDIIGGVLPYGSEPQVFDNSANEYVDRLMQELRPHLRRVDPLPIPDQHASFSRRVVLVTVHGSAAMRNGRAHGLTSIHRAGNCDIRLEGGARLLIGCGIGVNNLHGGFDAQAQFMGIRVGIRIDFRVARVRVQFGVGANVQSGGPVQLDRFSISEVASVRVYYRGLGKLGWIASVLTSVVVRAVRPLIVRAIEGPVREELRRVLARVPLPELS